MKKINLLIGILVALTSLACSSDDNQNDSLILGTWNLKSIKNQGVEVYTNNCENETETYNADFTASSYSITPFTTEPCQFNSSQFKWTKNGDLLITESNSGTQTELILTSKILLLNNNELETVTIIANGNEITEEEQKILRYEK